MARRSLQEHIERMKYLNGYKVSKSINEDAPMSVNGQQVQSTPQSQSQPNQNNDQNIDQQIDSLLNSPNLEKELTAAMDQVSKNLAGDLKQYATSSGDRDGQLEIQEQIGEAGVLLAAGAVLAVPKIVELMGSGLNKLGVKVNNQVLQKWGDKLSHFGHAIHAKYIGAIETVLKPITGFLDDKQRHALAGTILTMIVAGLGVASIAGAVGAIKAGHAGVAAIESGLSGVKAAELAEKVRELLPAALKASGVA